MKVSVPSRGILFPNIYKHIWFLKDLKTVSVPSRGILFPNFFETMKWFVANNYELFPSPLGVSYFQILPARARYFTGFSDSFAWQIIFLYIFLISNIHNRLQMQYLCGARQNYLFF